MKEQATGTLAALPGSSNDQKAKRIVDSLATGTRSRLVEHFQNGDIWAPSAPAEWLTVHALTRRGLVTHRHTSNERSVRLTPLGGVVLGLLLTLGSSSGIRNHELQQRRARILEVLDPYDRPLTTREIHDRLKADGYHVKLDAVRSSLQALERDRLVDRVTRAKAATAWKRHEGARRCMAAF